MSVRHDLRHTSLARLAAFRGDDPSHVLVLSPGVRGILSELLHGEHDLREAAVGLWGIDVSHALVAQVVLAVIVTLLR